MKLQHLIVDVIPHNKVHGANMGPIGVLSAPDGPYVGPMNLAIRDVLYILGLWAQNGSSELFMFSSDSFPSHYESNIGNNNFIMLLITKRIVLVDNHLLN